MSAPSPSGQHVPESNVSPSKSIWSRSRERWARVQMDEIRVKMQGSVVGWMAMAIQVSTRWWLGGVVPVRDSNLIGNLVARACEQCLV